MQKASERLSAFVKEAEPEHFSTRGIVVVMAYPQIGSTAWRHWLHHQKQFKKAQCFDIQGLIAMSREAQTPGELHASDDEIKGYMERSLESWYDLRDLMIDRRCMRFVEGEEGGYYEFSPRLDPRHETRPAESDPSGDWSNDVANQSVDALDRCRPCSDTERNWLRHIRAQVRSTWKRPLEDEERDEILTSLRQWVDQGNPGKDFEWNGFRAGGILSRKNRKTFVTNSTPGRDKTAVSNSHVVVAPRESNLEECDNNNITGRDKTSVTNSERDKNAPFAGEIVTEAEMQRLLTALAPNNVTEHVVRHDLLPRVGYAVCWQQAVYLTYRPYTKHQDNLGAIYHTACLENWAAPPLYSKEKARQDAEDHKKAQDDLERRKKEREEADKAENAARAEAFLSSLTRWQKERLQEEARARFAEKQPPLYKKLREHEDRRQEVPAYLRTLLQGAELSILEEWEASGVPVEPPTSPEEAAAAQAALAHFAGTEDGNGEPS